MRASQPLLRNQLLVWLLVPLVLLLGADAYVSYRITLGFARDAYDRSLIEIAHEVALHTRVEDGRLVLELPEPARRVLLSGARGRIYFSIDGEDGGPMAGEAVPGPNGLVRRGRRAEALYDASMHGEPVRVVEMHLASNRAEGRPGAVVRVAETQGKRTELAREMLLSVIAPQVLLILLAGTTVWVGVSYGLAPIMRLQRAVAARSRYDRSPVAVPDLPGEVLP